MFKKSLEFVSKLETEFRGLKEVIQLLVVLIFILIATAFLVASKVLVMLMFILFGVIVVIALARRVMENKKDEHH